MDSCVGIPSLERLCTIRIIVSLWSSEKSLSSIITLHKSNSLHADARKQFPEPIIQNPIKETLRQLRGTLTNLLQQLSSGSVLANWSDLTIQTQENASHLQLPTTSNVYKHLLGLIHPIGQQVEKWLRNFVVEPGALHIFKRCHQIRSYFVQIRWNFNLGTIDMDHTGRMVCQDTVIEPLVRFRVAGRYCLEDQVYTLWPLVERNRSIYMDPWLVNEPDLVTAAYFSALVDGNTEMLLKLSRINGYRYSSRWAYRYKHESAEMYFWKRMSPEEKMYLDVSASVYSQMTDEERTWLVANENILFLTSFLDWPYQDLFLSTVRTMIPVSSYHHEKIMAKLSEKIDYNEHDFIWTGIRSAYLQMTGLGVQLN